MSHTNRNELKDQLRAMIAEGGKGLDFDTPFHWVVEGLKQPAAFFEHLPELLPSDSVLYIEGTRIVPEVASFYSSHRARNTVDVVRDTIAPAPDIYHLSFSPEVSATFRQLADSHPVADIFDHIKAYRGESLLLTFHDAFDGWLLLSEHLSDEAVARFCQALGVSRRREETKRRDPEQLRRILLAFENPHKLRIAGEPWWRRLWRHWKKDDR